MNPNTGALIPMATPKGGEASQASGASGGAEEGLEGQADPTPGSESSGSSSGSEAEDRKEEQDETVRPASPKYDEAQGLGTPMFAAGPSQRRRTSIASWRQSQRRSAVESSLEEPLRPTSPKYDEAHGLSLPYLQQRRPQKRTSFELQAYAGTQVGPSKQSPTATSPALHKPPKPSFQSKAPLSPDGRAHVQPNSVTFASSRSHTPQSKTPLPLHSSQQVSLLPAATAGPSLVHSLWPGQRPLPETGAPVMRTLEGVKTPSAAVKLEGDSSPWGVPGLGSKQEGEGDSPGAGVRPPLGSRSASATPFKVPAPPRKAPKSDASPQTQKPTAIATSKLDTPPQESPPAGSIQGNTARLDMPATSAPAVPSPVDTPGPSLATLGPTMASPRKDRSQITPPSPVGGGTPVSQVGFRDPAIAGGGQQLTLMSIEVRSPPSCRLSCVRLLLLRLPLMIFWMFSDLSSDVPPSPFNLSRLALEVARMNMWATVFDSETRGHRSDKFDRSCVPHARWDTNHNRTGATCLVLASLRLCSAFPKTVKLRKTGPSCWAVAEFALHNLT
jgi:hypothetical protein